MQVLVSKPTFSKHFDYLSSALVSQLVLFA